MILKYGLSVSALCYAGKQVTGVEKNRLKISFGWAQKFSKLRPVLDHFFQQFIKKIRSFELSVG